MDGAVRVFAGEFNASTLQVKDNGADDASWIITPGGAWCRSMYLAGALTEVAGDGDMVRCRLADPTGAYDIVIGGRKTPLAETFRDLPVPSFVTVSGQARMYQKNGKTFLSLRPDEVRTVDRAVRDQWVLATAAATLERLDTLRLVLRNKSTDERALAPVRHYRITASSLLELGEMIERAVQSIRPPETASPVPSKDNARELVVELMTGSGPRGIAVEEIIDKARERGVAKETVLAAIESLIVDDECYQPQKGFVKAL